MFMAMMVASVVMPVPKVMVVPVMVVVPIPMMMAMPILMVMPNSAIVRLERRRHCGALKPVVGHQLFDLRPLLQADAAGQNLHRHVAIAKRQEKAGDRCEILGPHLDHRLDVGDDLGKSPIVEHQEIVSVQAGRRRKIELDTCTLAAEHKTLLPATVVEFQQQRIDDLAKGRTGWRIRRCITWPTFPRTFRCASGENSLRARHVSGPSVCQRPAGRSPPRSNGTTAARLFGAVEPLPAASWSGTPWGSML